jgi:hypothetical protein
MSGHHKDCLGCGCVSTGQPGVLDDSEYETKSVPVVAESATEEAGDTKEEPKDVA